MSLWAHWDDTISTPKLLSKILFVIYITNHWKSPLHRNQLLIKFWFFEANQSDPDNQSDPILINRNAPS